MGRKSRGSSRQRSESELIGAIETSLSTLQHMARIYDDGHPPIALAMSTEVRKLLTENSVATRLRGEKTFTTPDFDASPNMLNALHKLTGARMGGDPPTLDFIPVFWAPEGATRDMSFRDWWNRDVVYRASAAVPGTPAGMIPVNGSPEVPFEDREKVTRREFVDLLRNKLGAHEASEMPLLLDDLEDARGWGQFVMQTPQGILSTQDGTLSVGTGILAAMMRQITHEVLIAYGKVDNPPPLPT